MNSQSGSSNGMSNVEKSLTQISPPPTIFEALYAVAHANGCRISLIDHRGRRFFQKFFVDDVPAVRRYGVWAVAESGASRLVLWKGKGRGPSGNRVRSGWGDPRNAQKVADQLNEAAAAWCTQYGPVPKRKSTKSKKRK
jgi:hypothetical protein